MSGTLIGTISAIPKGRRIGFIVVEGHDDSFFFHEDMVADEDGFISLTPGQKVEFQPHQTARGPRALGVRKV